MPPAPLLNCACNYAAIGPAAMRAPCLKPCSKRANAARRTGWFEVNAAFLPLFLRFSLEYRLHRRQARPALRRAAVLPAQSLWGGDHADDDHCAGDPGTVAGETQGLVAYRGVRDIGACRLSRRRLRCHQ